MSPREPVPPAAANQPTGGAPGWPAPPAYAPSPGYPPYSPYPYPYAQWPAPYWQPPKPRRDTYQLVVSIIATVLLSVVMLVGLILLLALGVDSLAKASTTSNDLSVVAILLLAGSMALFGGGAGLFLTIRALMGRPSATMRLPSFVVPLALTAVVLGVGIYQYDSGLPQGPAIAQAPLVALSALLPAIAILAFTSQRLGNPSTWRRVWLSVLTGMFLAVTLSIILESIGLVALVLVSRDATISPTGLPNNSLSLVLLLVVVGPVVEEATKPIGALVILGRLRGPAEAFVVGMAGGLGFAVFESAGYISGTQADWVIVAVLRLGAGLLHGTGAGLAALGWYYLFRGQGVNRRWLKGVGAIAAAIGQHATWNGAAALVSFISAPSGNPLNMPIWFFGLPLQVGDLITIVLDLGVLAVLLAITGRLRRAPLHPSQATPEAAPAPPRVAAPLGQGRV